MKNLGFVVLPLLFFISEILIAQDDLGYQGQSTDKEKSIEQVLIELKSDPDVDVRESQGWTIASSRKLRTLWSFAPEDHEAHPSFVKREVVEEDGAFVIRTTAQCGASKNVCDKLVKDFIALNDKVREDVSGN